VVTCIQPRLIPGGVVGLAFWIAAHFSGNANSSGLSPLNGFIKRWCSTPFGTEATQAKGWLLVRIHPSKKALLVSALPRALSRKIQQIDFSQLAELYLEAIPLYILHLPSK